MRVWQGATPEGYSLVIERDEHQRWSVTVAGASRSRNHSLETALLEAAGASVSRSWLQQLATAILARTPAADNAP